MTDIPPDHPRYHSLMDRETLVRAVRDGLASEAGLMAHGRGEAFDYLLGERTRGFTAEAYRAAAALLLVSARPVISVNGNSTPLALADTVRLARAVPARVEVNLFHRTEGRVAKLTGAYRDAGLADVLGGSPSARIPSLGGARGMCEEDGIFVADTVLVLLEDGDRTEALRAMGKHVISVDLNPLSRTARQSSVCIVDNVIRALGKLADTVEALRGEGLGDGGLRAVVGAFDNAKSLEAAVDGIMEGLERVKGEL